MRKVSKETLERAIKAGMKSEGYSGKTLDRRAVEALRGAKMGKLLGKKAINQKQVYAALEALKKRGLISERVDEKRLIKKSVAEERRQEQREKYEDKQTVEDKERLQERTAKGYLRERQKEEGQDYSSIRKSISQEGTGEKRVHLGGEKPEVKSTGWSRPEESSLTRDKGQSPQSGIPSAGETGHKAEEPKDLPI